MSITSTEHVQTGSHPPSPFFPVPFIPEFHLYSGVIRRPVCYSRVLFRLLPPSLGQQGCVQAQRRQEATCPLGCCLPPLLKLPSCLLPELCISLDTCPLGSGFPRHHLASSLPGSLMSCWQHLSYFVDFSCSVSVSFRPSPFTLSWTGHSGHLVFCQCAGKLPRATPSTPMC